MRTHTFLAPLLALFVLVFAGTVYGQEVTTSLGTGVSAANNMNVSNTDIVVQVNFEVTRGKFLSLHTAQYDAVDTASGGHDDAALTYDGNLMFERRHGSWAYGIGLRADTAMRSSAWSPSAAIRPYLVLAKRTDTSLSTIKVLLPGTDGWRTQVGLLGQHDFKFLTVNGYRMAVYITGGVFSYREGAPVRIPVSQVNGVVTYANVSMPRTIGEMVGVGLKFYFK